MKDQVHLDMQQNAGINTTERKLFTINYFQHSTEYERALDAQILGRTVLVGAKTSPNVKDCNGVDN